MDNIIAQNRFGLGINPKENKTESLKLWFEKQFYNYEASPTIIASSPKTHEILHEAFLTNELKRKNPQDAKVKAQEKKLLRDLYFKEINNRFVISASTKTPFMERLVHFWANHFAISADKVQVRALAGAYENEAIRPNILGNFRDLLIAIIMHPAMLIYLDQNQSIGPNSIAAQRRKKNNPTKEFGLNENLAREIMELHSLGVNGGYSQNDVTEFAKALTGFSIVNLRYENFGKLPANKKIGDFIFTPIAHEQGTRKIMGKSYSQEGMNQALAIIDDLSNHPATALNIATKLARHFAGDNPPQSLINKLKQSFMQTNGDLKSLYLTLINSPECYVSNQVKFKTPWEWLISASRAMAIDDFDRIDAQIVMQNLGQMIWQPKSPKGFDDTEDSWAAPDAILRRIETANLMTKNFDPPFMPIELAQKILGNQFSEHTKTVISRAESIQSASALLLVSPEFLRR